MNGRERVALAIRGEQPDRVPVMSQLALGHYHLNTDVDPVDLWFTSEGHARALVELQQRYRFDGILISLPGRPDGVLDRITSRVRTDDGQELEFDTGERVLVPWDDDAVYDPGTSGRKLRFDFAADEVSDLDNVDDIAGYVWGIYFLPFLPGKPDKGPLTEVPDYFYGTIDRVRDLTDGQIAIHGECFSPFTHYMELIGYEKALMTLLIDPAKAHALLDRLTGATIAWAVGQAEHGVDAVLVSSAFAGGPMLSPSMYREFVSPYESRVNEAVHAAGVPIYVHTCGSIADRLDLIVETGTDGIDTLDPPPLGTVDLEDAKRQIGDQVFIKGNMDPVFILQAGEPEAIIAHAADRIAAGAPGGGYILSTACSVSPATEPWKLELLTPLAENIGKYAEPASAARSEEPANG